jgi:hypothetical protein
MNWPRWSLAALLAGGAAGCAPATITPHVEYVWTSTPGVVFVIVQPSKQAMKSYPVQNDVGSATPVDPRAWYLLVCDARKSDGMHCDIASEASIKRYSYTPSTVASGPSLDDGVGTLDNSIHIEQTEKERPSANPPGPAPAPIPIPAPPPPVPGGKK